MGLGRLGLRRWLAVLGFLLGTGLGVCLGSLVVWPLLVWPVAAYSYYPDYSYDWSDDPPPYRPDSSPNSSHDRDPSASVSPPNSDHTSNHSSNYDDNHFNLNPGSSTGNNGSVQDGQTPQPEAAPNSPAPTPQSPGTPGLAVFEPWEPVCAGLI